MDSAILILIVLAIYAIFLVDQWLSRVLWRRFYREMTGREWHG